MVCQQLCGELGTFTNIVLGMSRLVHLREIIVDNNELVNIDGIMQLDGLLRLSIRGNKLETLNFENSNLYVH
jgi:hypothetical protein